MPFIVPPGIYMITNLSLFRSLPPARHSSTHLPRQMEAHADISAFKNIVGDDAFHRPECYLTIKLYDNYFGNKFDIITFSLSVLAPPSHLSRQREAYGNYLHTKDEKHTAFINGTMLASSPTLFW